MRRQTGARSGINDATPCLKSPLAFHVGSNRVVMDDLYFKLLSLQLSRAVGIRSFTRFTTELCLNTLFVVSRGVRTIQMPQQHPFCRETVTFAVPPESLITVNCSVPAPTGECRGCHLEFCPVAVGLPETACGDSNHPHQQTAVFCIGCFLHSCTICDSPWRFLVARAESLLHLMREDSAFLRAVGESKAVRSHLASCLSRLALNRKADRCSELLCEALALMIMVSAEEIVCDGIWQKLPPEAVVLTLRQVFEISPVATHSAVLAYLVQPDNPQLLTCVDVVARGESGELVVAAASEVVELAVGYVLGKEELESASMWFIDSALCRGLVSRFSRGQRNDTAMRIMLMIAGCQEAVDALFMG